MLNPPSLPDLAVFMGLILVLALFGLTVSGQFPVEFRAPSLTTLLGKAILWGTLAIAAILTVLALAFAWERLPLYATIIGGGGMVLIAPLLLQRLPDGIVDGRAALITLAFLGLVLLVLAGQLLT